MQGHVNVAHRVIGVSGVSRHAGHHFIADQGTGGNYAAASGGNELPLL